MPKELNAFECAKAGYINIGANKVKCICCQHLVHFKAQAGVVIPDQTLQRMINRVIYGHKPDCLFHRSKGIDVKPPISFSSNKTYSLRKRSKSNNEGAETVDLDGLKEKILMENHDEFETKFTKFYLDWDIQLLNNIKSYESLSKTNPIMPLISNKMLATLGGQISDTLWLPVEKSVKEMDDSFYVPSILALFGWKAESTGETSYNLVCEDGCRKIPVSIMVNEAGLVQKWTTNEQKAKENDVKADNKSGIELVEWIKNKNQFLFDPLNDHMEFCQQLTCQKERYLQKLNMLEA